MISSDTKFFFFVFVIFAVLLFLESTILDPKDSNKLNIVSISFTRGRFSKITGLSKRIVEAKMGRAAFLLPEIFTVPLVLHGPLIKNLSMFI